MNSTLCLTEEAQGTSSIEPARSSEWWLVHNMRVPFEGSSTATAIAIVDGMNWYDTLTGGYSRPQAFVRPHAVQTARVEYRDAERTDNLLGAEGKKVLGEVIDLISNVSSSRKWALSHVVVDYVEDNEAEDWQYVLVVPVFKCRFDTADEHLHELYPELDEMVRSYGAERQNIMQGKIFFDVAAPL